MREAKRYTRAQKEKLQKSYTQLLNATRQVVAQAKRIAEEVKKQVKKSRKLNQERLTALKAATVDQVAVAALMTCMEKLIVDAPAIVDQKCIEVFAQKLDRLLITSAWKNAVDGRIVAHRRPEPPTDVHPTRQPDSSMVTLTAERT